MIDDGSVEEPDGAIIEEPITTNVPEEAPQKPPQTVTHTFRNYFALPIELPNEMCFDNIDNDLNGLVDCADSACSETCVEICDNGLDDDGDNKIDCDDEECVDFNACTPVEICNNNIDDDGDTLVDCLDSDCPSCPEPELPSFVRVSTSLRYKNPPSNIFWWLSYDHTHRKINS